MGGCVPFGALLQGPSEGKPREHPGGSGESEEARAAWWPGGSEGRGMLRPRDRASLPAPASAAREHAEGSQQRPPVGLTGRGHGWPRVWVPRSRFPGTAAPGASPHPAPPYLVPGRVPGQHQATGRGGARAGGRRGQSWSLPAGGQAVGRLPRVQRSVRPASPELLHPHRVPHSDRGHPTAAPRPVYRGPASCRARAGAPWGEGSLPVRRPPPASGPVTACGPAARPQDAHRPAPGRLRCDPGTHSPLDRLGQPLPGPQGLGTGGPGCGPRASEPGPGPQSEHSWPLPAQEGVQGGDWPRTSLSAGRGGPWGRGWVTLPSPGCTRCHTQGGRRSAEPVGVHGACGAGRQCPGVPSRPPARWDPFPGHGVTALNQGPLRTTCPPGPGPWPEGKAPSRHRPGQAPGGPPRPPSPPGLQASHRPSPG